MKWHLLCQGSSPLQGVGDPSPAVRQHLMLSLSDCLAYSLLFFLFSFFPDAIAALPSLYLPPREQAVGSLGWLPLARLPSLAARGSDLAHLPSNGCRAGPGWAGMGTRWSHRLPHRDTILLAGKLGRCHQDLAVSRHLAVLSLAVAADVGTRRPQSCQVSMPTSQGGLLPFLLMGKGEEPTCWLGLEPGEHVAAAFMAYVTLTHETRIPSEKDLHLPNVLRGGHVGLGSSPPLRW